MIRRPPRSTLFPYPPLFRSKESKRRIIRLPRAAAWPTAEIAAGRMVCAGERRRSMVADPDQPTSVTVLRARARSEEHTSELQSRQYLVCRLLLEKKKKHVS